MPYNITVLIALLLGLSGCAKIPKVTPVSDHAYLSGSNKNDFNILIDFKNPFSKSVIEFISLDTVYLGNYSSNPTSINITPGVHTIVAKCMIFSSKHHIAPKHKYTRSKDINMYFKENTYYSFTGFVGKNRKCQIQVHEHEGRDYFTAFSTKSSAKDYKNIYLKNKNHKAFAQSSTGFWAWSSNQVSLPNAKQTALNNCKKSNSKSEERYPCKIIDINGTMAD